MVLGSFGGPITPTPLLSEIQLGEHLPALGPATRKSPDSQGVVVPGASRPPSTGHEYLSDDEQTGGAGDGPRRAGGGDLARDGAVTALRAVGPERGARVRAAALTAGCTHSVMSGLV